MKYVDRVRQVRQIDCMIKPSSRPVRIFQTRQWPASAENALDQLGNVTRDSADRPLSAEELRAGLKSCDIFCPTVSDRIDAQVLEGLDLTAKLIANYGAGVSHIDCEAVRASGGAITNTPDILTKATAEIAMSLMLAAARRTGEGERQLRSGGWEGWRPMHLLGCGVSGRTLGLVGFGRIAQAFARIAHFGFEMQILVSNRSPVDRSVLEAVHGHQAEFDTMLAQADFVSLHIPGGPSTRHLFDATIIGKMKRGAILINTARGEIVDEAALIQALDDGRVAAAGLDVFEHEPQIHPDLLMREDVVLLPHLGSATQETRTAMGLRVADNVAAWLRGERPRDLVE